MTTINQGAWDVLCEQGVENHENLLQRWQLGVDKAVKEWRNGDAMQFKGTDVIYTVVNIESNPRIGDVMFKDDFWLELGDR